MSKNQSTVNLGGSLEGLTDFPLRLFGGSRK